MANGTGDGGKPPNVNSRSSVPAIIAFALILIWVLVLVGLFIAATSGYVQKLDNLTATLIGGVVSTSGMLLTTAVNFFLGSSSGTKTLGDSMAENNKANSTALATIAGASAPPAPTLPTDPATPTPVTVVPTPGEPIPVTTEPAADPPHFMDRPL